MFVPFLSSPSSERRKLWRRKGGGGGGRGGGGSVSSGSGKSTSSSSSSGSSGRTSTINTGAGSKPASNYGGGTTTVTTIPAGSGFAGRTVGGGTRSNVYGSRTYGSGYPGVVGNRGVAGLGFPFFFWPVTFGGAAYAGTHYYHHSDEYGDANNNTRPGGSQKVAIFKSGQSETFRLLADGESVESLVEVIKDKCDPPLVSADVSVEDYDGSDIEPPLPEQVIQYYRASSIALSLDSYNNTAVFAEDVVPDVPIPTDSLSTEHLMLMRCLNETIGEAAPLIDESAAASLSSPSSLLVLGLAVALIRAQL